MFKLNLWQTMALTVVSAVLAYGLGLLIGFALLHG